MKKILSKCLVAATVLGFVSVPAAGGAADNGIAREMYRQGEVVIAGAVAQVPAGYRVKKVLPHAGLIVLQVAKGSEQEHVASLAALGISSGLNLHYQALFVPDDPLYAAQWNFPMVQSEAAWDITTGTGVTVAVLDTGLKTAGAADGISCVEIEPGSDIVNGDSDPEDGEGHGTHVSGTVAQATDNGAGTAGLAHGACIMPVKVLNDLGAGASADIAEGVAFAVAHGASVINMSIGWKAQLLITSDPILDPQLAEAHAAGVTIVCASGNDAWRKQVSYPAISPYTIAVGAVDMNGVIASYSNGGTGLDLVAPGGGGTTPGDAILQETFHAGGWDYISFSGTSMAAPHVSAAAALLYATKPDITPEEVRTALTSSARDLGHEGYDSDYGHGLLQTHAALVSFTHCLDEDGDSWTTCSGDCNDGSAGVNPGAAEICADLLDNNCDGRIDDGCVECTDNDGDGWSTCDGDCDDANLHVNPAHPDSSGRWGSDGIDNDCDGVADR
ncbi:MAG: S8 family serine peptidase [Deltaproteobacteria bacterium]|nr:S8 family serine peptidase [Deltaproteobacteria bacterium]